MHENSQKGIFCTENSNENKKFSDAWKWSPGINISDMKPELSIVIPTLGFDSIKKTIDSILEHKGDTNIEIIVIGNISRDILNRYKKLKFFRYIPFKSDRWDLSIKKNIGFKEAKADYVAFPDDDTEISKEWIERGLRHFKDKKVGLVSGPGVTPLRGAPFLMRLFGNTLASLGSGPMRRRYRTGREVVEDKDGEKVIGCNMVARKKVYEKTKGFDPDLRYTEDSEFAFRVIKAGYKVHMDYNFYLFHYARADFKKFFMQIFRYGASKIRVIKNKAQKFKFAYILPMLTIIYFPVFLIASFFNRWIFLTLISLALLYLLFLLISTLESLIRTKDLSNLALLLTIPYMHLAYGLGELYEFFKIMSGK